MADEPDHPIWREMEERRLRQEAFAAAERRALAPWREVEARLGEVSRYGHEGPWDWPTVVLDGWDATWLTLGETVRARPDLLAAYKALLPGLRRSAQQQDDAERNAERVLEGIWEAAVREEPDLPTVRALVAICDGHREVYKRILRLLNEVRNSFARFEDARIARELYDEFPDLASESGYARPADPTPDVGVDEVGTGGFGTDEEDPPPDPERGTAADCHPLRRREVKVLQALKGAGPRLLLNVDIEAAAGLSKITVQRALGTLIPAGLVHCPEGDQAGKALTEKGRLVADRLPDTDNEGNGPGIREVTAGSKGDSPNHR